MEKNAQISLRNEIFRLVLASSPTTRPYCHIQTALRTCLYDPDKLLKIGLGLRTK